MDDLIVDCPLLPVVDEGLNFTFIDAISVGFIVHLAHLPGKLHNLPAQFHKVNGMFLQLVEQCHRLLSPKKWHAQLFNDLIVVRADGTELGVEVRQFGVVVQHRLVHLSAPWTSARRNAPLRKTAFAYTSIPRTSSGTCSIPHHRSAPSRSASSDSTWDFSVLAFFFILLILFGLMVCPLFNLLIKNPEIIRLRRIILPTVKVFSYLELFG